MRIEGGHLPKEASRVAPWGCPLTPLLPNWYIDKYADLPVPKASWIENPSIERIGELGRFWDIVRAPIKNRARGALIDFAKRYPLPPTLIVVDEYLDRFALPDYPLRLRTRNALVRSNFLRGSGGAVVEELLSLRAFGIASLLDLMCVVEAAGLANNQGLLPHRSQSEFSSDSTDYSGEESTVVVLNIEPRAVLYHHRHLHDRVARNLGRLLAAAHEFYGAVTVGEALDLDLGKLSGDLKINEELDSYKISSFANESILDSVIDGLRELQTKLSDRESDLLERSVTLARKDRPTLGELGRAHGVTRERIRQLVKSVERKVAERIGVGVSVIASVLLRKIGPVTRESTYRDHVDMLFEGKSLSDKAVEIARRSIEASLDYDSVQGVRATKEAQRSIREFRDQAHEFSDEVGLIDEEALRATLTDKQWRQVFELLVARCRFVRIHGQLARRATRRARVKAAVIALGRSATIEEIAALAELPAAGISSLLSRTPGIARATISKWGLEEWIEDVYEGIAAEIIHRINEDGGCTTMERLLRELPETFEVKEASVRAIVGSLRFVLQNGNVQLAKADEVVIGDVFQVADGVTKQGRPYWNFRVRPIHFDGHSVAGVPPEIAVALGCPVNGRSWATVLHPSGCGRVSVTWRLTSVTWASIGYISGALDRLNARVGDRVSLVIVEPGIVEFRLDVQDAESESGGVGILSTAMTQRAP